MVGRRLAIVTGRLKIGATSIVMGNNWQSLAIEESGALMIFGKMFLRRKTTVPTVPLT